MGSMNDLRTKTEEAFQKLPRQIQPILSERREKAISLGSDGGLYMGQAYHALITNFLKAEEKGLTDEYLIALEKVNGGNVDKFLLPSYIDTLKRIE